MQHCCPCDGPCSFLRLSAGGPAGPSSADAWVEGDDKDWNISDDCMAGATFALQGVDLVAYFSLGEGDEPVLGSSDHVAAYGDYRFKFSSAKNRALFEVMYPTYLWLLFFFARSMHQGLAESGLRGQDRGPQLAPPRPAVSIKCLVRLCLLFSLWCVCQALAWGAR